MKISIISLIIACFTVKMASAALTPVQLRCEYLIDPSVIDAMHPRLSWVNITEAGERNQQQTAWQVRVAASREKLTDPDLWDSHKIYSHQATRIQYKGKGLVSRQECWWQVRVWDRDDNPSGWSKPASWRMGLLEPSDWKAEWIGAPWQGEEALPKTTYPGEYLKELPPPAPMFRKEFIARKKVVKAVAYVTGLGYFELYVNGKKAGDDVLVPNQTNYGKRPQIIDANLSLKDEFREYRVMYLAYDIKDLLRKGKNVIGSILGNGFYNPAKFWTASYGSPRFLGQVYITYDDDTEDVITTGTDWKVSESPVVMDMVYFGEHYDARLEQPGWCKDGFDDSKWQNAAIRKAPEGKLVAHTALPDRVTQCYSPLSIMKTEKNSYILDFGLEISGRLRLNDVKGPAGNKIMIRYISNTYSGDNTLILKGGKPESYAARFNWFVFSKVEISGWPGELKKEQITAEAVNTAIEETATFETSDTLFNEINRIWKRSQLDNMHGGLPSDCPHRERSPYTGDGQVTCVTVMDNFDARAFYHKWVQDILGAQNITTGYVPNSAPWQPGCGGGVGWGAAICIIPWEFYVHYGDTGMLQDTYEGMKGYIRYMQSWVNDNGIMYSQRTGRNGRPNQWFNLGEWCAPGKTVPDSMVHTYFFWRCADLTAKTAEVLHKTDEAAYYTRFAETTRQAFMKTFYDEKKSSFGNGGGNIFALKMGVPDSCRNRVIASLMNEIQENGGHLNTGIFGTRLFFEVLSDNGMHDLAYEAMSKRTYPGYGWWIEQGATTTRENWNGEGSHNHPMFGGGLVWFYTRLAGMNADPFKPGYRHIIFQPRPSGNISYVSYSNETSYGRAGIAWQKDSSGLIIDIVVPVSCRATIVIPSGNVNSLTESGIPARWSKDVKLVSAGEDTITLETGSGEYHFAVRE